MKTVITSSRIIEHRHLRGRDEEPYAPVEFGLRLPGAMPIRDAPNHTWLIVALFLVVVTACGLRACNERKEATAAAEMEAVQ